MKKDSKFNVEGNNDTKGLNPRPNLFGNLLQPATVITLLKQSFFIGIYVKLRDLIVIGTGRDAIKGDVSQKDSPNHTLRTIPTIDKKSPICVVSNMGTWALVASVCTT